MWGQGHRQERATLSLGREAVQSSTEVRLGVQAGWAWDDRLPPTLTAETKRD
jgi:hypothetical protein